jgi:hypothetical protein
MGFKGDVMALSGSLETLNATEILQVLYLHGKDGLLLVRSHDLPEPGEVFFRHGRIVRARAGRAVPNIGELLILLGVVDEAQVRLAAEVQRTHDRDKPLGAILVEIGAATPEDVREAMTQQIERAVEVITAWARGSFEFEPLHPRILDDIAVDPRGILPEIGVDAQRVVLEAARRRDEATA